MIAPSILAADFANLEREVKMLNQSAADWIHVDIMDGVFVPNISFGLPIVEAIKKHATKPLDVHLMIVQPEKYIENFYKAGADIISVHIEACPHLHRTIEQIKSMGIKAGVALNPHTPSGALTEILTNIDLVCVMSVNPGFGGQKFITHTYNKTAKIRQLLTESKSKALIEVDGGVNLNNANQLIAQGADVLVVGNFVFSSPHPIETIQRLKSI